MSVILVPINFSETSQKALRQAVQIGKKDSQTRILLFHGSTVEDSTEEVESRLLDLEKQYTQTNLQFERRILSEFSPLKVAQLAQKEKVDLVVMGTEGKNRLRGFWQNSHTAKVEELLTCPLMVVPKNAPEKEIRKMAYALSFVKSDLREIDRILRFAHLFDAHLECLRLVDTTQKEDESLLAVLKDAYDLPKYQDKISFKSLKSRNLARSIENYVREHKIDMTVLLTQQRNFWEKNFGNSLTQKLTLHAKIPLLILNKDHNITSSITSISD